MNESDQRKLRDCFLIENDPMIKNKNINLKKNEKIAYKNGIYEGEYKNGKKKAEAFISEIVEIVMKVSIKMMKEKVEDCLNEILEIFMKASLKMAIKKATEF